MIKSKLAIALAMGCISSIASAGLDSELKKLGIVDEDYRYTDIETAHQIFKTFTKQFRANLPEKIDDNIEITAISLSPFNASVTYNIDPGVPLDETHRVQVLQAISNPNFLKAICEQLYDNQTYIVNGLVWDITVTNNDLGTLFDMKLNNKICQSTYYLSD